MKRLVFIHGINNELNSRDQIETMWANALSSSEKYAGENWLDGVEIRTAYFADLLAQETADWEKVNASGTRMSADAPDEDYADEDIAALYLEIQEALGITDDQIAAELDPEDKLPAATRMAAGVHKKWLKAIARTLEKVAPGGGRGLAKLFLEQAAAYLHKPQTFDKVNDTVRDQVLQGLGDGSRTVIVGHSLGSVISYVLLRQMRNVEMPLLVTLGSPLGIGIVKKRIGPVYVRPPSIQRWVNGADREDFVALYPVLDDRSFGPAKVENFAELDNGHQDAHSVERYLQHSPVSGAIRLALG